MYVRVHVLGGLLSVHCVCLVLNIHSESLQDLCCVKSDFPVVAEMGRQVNIREQRGCWLQVLISSVAVMTLFSMNDMYTLPILMCLYVSALLSCCREGKLKTVHSLCLV